MILSVGETCGILSLISNVEVKLFVGATYSTDVGGILRPIESSDERVMLGKALVESVSTIVAD